MATFFLTTLCVSIVGLLLLFGIKGYEMRSGRTLLRGVRPALNRTSGHTIMFVGHILPGVARQGAVHAARTIFAVVWRAWISTLRFCEALLERVLSRVRTHSVPKHPSKEASSFLREVSEHKRSLEGTRDRAIFEE